MKKFSIEENSKLIKGGIQYLRERIEKVIKSLRKEEKVPLKDDVNTGNNRDISAI